MIYRVIFGPEHGFRGNASAGEKVGNYIDKQTGIPVISLYGSKHAPDSNDLKDIDVLDLRYPGCGRPVLYLYLSLQYFMEAAFENSKPLMILDRPNPNGFYVDGPVLDMKYKSGIGPNPYLLYTG